MLCYAFCEPYLQLYCCRCDVSNRYSDVKKSVSSNYAIANSTNVKQSEPEYEAVIVNDYKRDCDVKIDANPAYHATS